MPTTLSRTLAKAGIASGALAVALWALVVYLFKTGKTQEQNAASLLQVLRFTRGKNFLKFMQQHREAYSEGKRTGNFVTGVINYYTIMSELITTTSGPFWHFVPMYRGLSRAECHEKFHHTLCEYLEPQEDHRVLELGCGYMEMGRQVARISGAEVVGLTMADAEIVGGTQRIRDAGLDKLCTMVQGDYHELPFDDNTLDRVFGIYTLKYSARLQEVMNEAFRVLKPGGRFLSYEILVSDLFNKDDSKHCAIAENISASTCMPPLWPACAFRKAAKDAGFTVHVEKDLCDPSTGVLQWYNCFERTWMYNVLTFPALVPACKLAERLHILTPGFADWFEHCCIHPPVDFVDGGRAGIVTGAVMMTWTKP